MLHLEPVLFGLFEESVDIDIIHEHIPDHRSQPREANEANAKTLKGLNAATQSADNAISGICSAIVKAQQTPVRTRLDDESLKQLHDSHTQWLGQEKQTLDDHHKQQKESWQKHSQRLTDIVKNNEGVWISTKQFYIVGSLSLLPIITITIEIAIYVYFKWIHKSIDES